MDAATHPLVRFFVSEFDLSIYFPLPLLTTEGYVSLSKTLFSVKPEQPPGQAKQAIAGLEKIVSEAEAGLVERIDEDLSTGRERSFDIFVDRVWSELRERLEFFENYKHDGVARAARARLRRLNSATPRGRDGTLVSLARGAGEVGREAVPSRAELGMLSTNSGGLGEFGLVSSWSRHCGLAASTP